MKKGDIVYYCLEKGVKYKLVSEPGNAVYTIENLITGNRLVTQASNVKASADDCPKSP